ncbi:hypothetical protein FJZ28_01520 [Candidatus Peregrinibacteria bacterium]|nr:hypothetical protein [Candidatus Peregrinibacteria bacterium]
MLRHRSLSWRGHHLLHGLRPSHTVPVRQRKLDLANASGPIATILQDILSVTVYFAIASWML